MHQYSTYTAGDEARVSGQAHSERWWVRRLRGEASNREKAAAWFSAHRHVDRQERDGKDNVLQVDADYYISKRTL